MGDLYERFIQSQAQTSPAPYGLEVDRAEGVFIYDTSGNRYYDMTSGLAVANVGHNHSQVIEAVQRQLERHMHVMPYGEYAQYPQVELAEMLASFLPEKLSIPYFVNSGAEANEAALKLAKRITQRIELVAFKGAYHGNTHGAMSVSSNENKKSAFRPLLPEIKFLEFNHVQDLDQITERTAGVIIEPIQGDAGIRVPDREFMTELRAVCDRTGALLIFDEIQTGMGRTGTLFAFENFGVMPDILTLAKALGGGMPIGAFCSSKDHMDKLTHEPMLGHITTFGGHPISCAAAVQTLKLIGSNSLLESITNKNLIINSLLNSRNIIEKRGIGLMIAVELGGPEAVQRVVRECGKKGVLLFWFLSCPDSFRLTPPLTITDEELTEACGIINDVINEVGGQ